MVKAASVEEMKQCLTGRDAKNIISNAVRNLGAMLEFAYADSAAIAAALAAAAPVKQKQKAPLRADEGWVASEDEEDEAADADDLDAEDDELRAARHFDTFTYRSSF